METRVEQRLVPRALLWGALAAFVPTLFALIAARSPFGLLSAIWLGHFLRYTLALVVFVLIHRGSRRRPRGYLGGTVVGVLGAGFIVVLLALLFPSWLSPWTSLSRVLFEGAEAAVVGWCLAAAATAWGKSAWSPILGLFLGALVAGISSAWLPMPDGIWMAAYWGLRTLVEYAPLAIMYHLWTRGEGKDEKNLD